MDIKCVNSPLVVSRLVIRHTFCAGFQFPEELLPPAKRRVSEEKSVPCDLCHRRFSTRACMVTHRSNIHGSLQGPFPCVICGKMSKNKRSLNTHMYEYHRTNFRKLKMSYQEHAQL